MVLADDLIEASGPQAIGQGPGRARRRETRRFKEIAHAARLAETNIVTPRRWRRRINRQTLR
jgi:hypothetical protein